MKLDAVPEIHRQAFRDLCARAPWSTIDGALDADGLLVVFRAIQDATEDAAPRFPWGSGSDRRIDRALQLLRKQRIVVYAGQPKRWQVVVPPAST